MAHLAFWSGLDSSGVELKAQLAIDYFISLLIFALIVAYIGFQLLSVMPSYKNEIKGETLRSEAYQISEMLINDAGDPVNWNDNPSFVNRTGLSNHIENKTNLLSVAKIHSFNASCEGNGYDNNISRWIGIDPNDPQRYQFNITLINMSGSPLFPIDCSPPSVISRPTVVRIERTVAFDNGNYGKLILRVW